VEDGFDAHAALLEALVAETGDLKGIEAAGGKGCTPGGPRMAFARSASMKRAAIASPKPAPAEQLKPKRSTPLAIR
jgi:hypothetical protein